MTYGIRREARIQALSRRFVDDVDIVDRVDDVDGSSILLVHRVHIVHAVRVAHPPPAGKTGLQSLSKHGLFQ